MSDINKIKLGIIFGGSSREREISFAGGRTIFDNLDKEFFEPVLIFVDSFRNFILLDWQHIYKGSIRDFFPTDRLGSKENLYIESVFESDQSQGYVDQVNSIGSLLTLEEIKASIDFAFLCLHGESGEDGQIQGLFKFMDIPFSGSNVFASSLGMDKSIQKRLIRGFDSNGPRVIDFGLSYWSSNTSLLIAKVDEKIGYPCVVRPANQGSSIGVRIVNSSGELEAAVEAAFFIRKFHTNEWTELSSDQKSAFCSDIIDIRNDLGYPLICNSQTCLSPEELYACLEKLPEEVKEVELQAFQTEHTVMVEEFIDGREFSCIVIRDLENNAVALPPTEIIKGGEVYDYRSKYLPGLSRKETPIVLPVQEVDRIREKAQGLFEYFGFQVYARIDGFYMENGKIILNDPNTTSGMLPSSFFFHQAAEIGWTPSGFISYIIGQSIKETIKLNLQRSTKGVALEKQLKALMSSRIKGKSNKTKVAVILGGYSSERHISVESGRNIFEKLSGTEHYAPEPIFLSKKDGKLIFHRLPMNLLLKNNSDDILIGLDHTPTPWVQKLNGELSELVTYYQEDRLVNKAQEISIEELADSFDFAFIALHGRPGEDGELQKIFEEYRLAYNGSNHQSASLTINKYKTLQKLKSKGFTVANQMLIDKTDYLKNPDKEYLKVNDGFVYPLIAKPVDDGCSSAVKKIDSELNLRCFLQAAFREDDEISEELAGHLDLKYREEFPKKNQILIEQLISQKGADHFMEITGGLLCSYHMDGSLSYDIFHPSETIAGLDILSLEEKFLAGEGTNITPPRYHKSEVYQREIDIKVREKLKEVAKIFNVESYARIDAFVRINYPSDVEVIIIEINSLPGMTPATAIFHQAALSNMTPYDFVHRIIEFGIKRNNLKE